MPAAPAPHAVLLGAMLGFSGLALLFWPELAGLRADQRLLLGVASAVGGTVIASAGNLLSQRVFAAGVPLTFDASAPYVLSLLGSIAAFVIYLRLLQRGRAEAAPPAPDLS
jgi:drug/metabolite transporter (DMT)-like permease